MIKFNILITNNINMNFTNNTIVNNNYSIFKPPIEIFVI